MANAPTLLYKTTEDVPVHSLLFLDPSIKDNTLLTGAKDGTVVEWNMNCLRKAETFQIGNDICLGFKTLDNTLFTQDKWGVVKLWKPFKTNWKQIGTIEIDYTGFSKIDVTKNFEGLVACPTRHSVVSVYSVKDCKKVMTLQRDSSKSLLGDIMALKFIDLMEKSFLLVAYESGDLDMYDLKMRKLLSNLKLNDCILSLDFHSESMRGLCGSVGNQVQSFKVNSSMMLEKSRHLQMFNAGVGVVKIIPHKKIAVIGGWDGIVRVLSWRNLNTLGGLTENCSEIHDIDFSTKHMAATDSEGNIFFWSL